MNDKRTQDAAGLLICQHCGVVLKQRVKNCRDCGSVMSRYSPTVMPSLVIKRAPASSPQNLRPENDTLLVERVITRCKFNEVMRPKPKGFHGSRAFLEEGKGEPVAGGAAVEAAGMAGVGSGVAGGAASAPSVTEAPSSDVNAFNARFEPNSGGAQTPVPDPFSPAAPRPGAQGGDDFFRAAIKPSEPVPNAPPHVDAPVRNETSAPSTKHAPLAESGEQPSLVRKAPLPSFMVADMLLLVVQDTDGHTISLTQAVEGPELPPVFGLFPSSSDFNIVFAQELPLTAVSLSANALSFHDANREGEVSVREDRDSVLNIDSRLAFEEGLSRISALRMQGALARSGVLGFEKAENASELRNKFTTKVALPGVSDSDSDTADGAPVSVGVSDEPAFGDQNAIADDVRDLLLPGDTARDTARDGASERPIVAKPKERSVFNPKRAPVEELNEEIDVQKIRANAKNAQIKHEKKNPLAMVVAALGIVLVLGVVGFIAYTKVGELSGGKAGGSATTSGAVQLPKLWQLVLTGAEDGQTFQNFGFELEQSGSQLTGRGRDQIGDFTVEGELSKGDSIAFQKQYESAGYIWPIMFSGRLAQGADGSFATGTYSWRKSDVEHLQGNWVAGVPGTVAPGMQGGQTQPGMQPGMQGQPGVPAPPGMQGQPGMPQGAPQQGLPQQGFPQQQGFPASGQGFGGMPQAMPTQGGFGTPGGGSR